MILWETRPSPSSSRGLPPLVPAPLRVVGVAYIACAVLWVRRSWRAAGRCEAAAADALAATP